MIKLHKSWENPWYNPCNLSWFGLLWKFSEDLQQLGGFCTLGLEPQSTGNLTFRRDLRDWVIWVILDPRKIIIPTGSSWPSKDYAAEGFWALPSLIEAVTTIGDFPASHVYCGFAVCKHFGNLPSAKIRELLKMAIEIVEKNPSKMVIFHSFLYV